MKLIGQRNSLHLPYSVGFDEVSNQYILADNDTTGNIRYYIISKEEYDYSLENADLIDEIYYDCIIKNNKSERFFFSNWMRENSTSQQQYLAQKYSWIELFENKKRDEVHRITNPDRIEDDGKYEYYQFNATNIVTLEYENDYCIKVTVL